MSAEVTVIAGTRFTYDDNDSGERRVGYYDVASNRLTVLSDDERAIITHFPPSRGEQYCRDLPNSTYR